MPIGYILFPSRTSCLMVSTGILVGEVWCIAHQFTKATRSFTLQASDPQEIMPVRAIPSSPKGHWVNCLLKRPMSLKSSSLSISRPNEPTSPIVAIRGLELPKKQGVLELKKKGLAAGGFCTVQRAVRKPKPFLSHSPSLAKAGAPEREHERKWEYLHNQPTKIG